MERRPTEDLGDGHWVDVDPADLATPPMSEADGMRTAVARQVWDAVLSASVDVPAAFDERVKMRETITANTTDAILRLVSLGEPVAWRWESWSSLSGTWTTRLTHDRPGDHKNHRNIQPLYAPPSTQEASQ